MRILQRGLLLSGLLSLLGPTAGAQTADVTRAQAQAAMREGNALLADGHAVEALAKFKSAYTVFPSPKLYYNVGQAESLIPGHEAQAYDAMSRFLVQAKDANPGLRAAAEMQRQQLRSKVGVVTIVAEPPDAQLVVDGAPVSVTERAEGLVLGIGVHALMLHTDAGTSNTDQVAIAGGEAKVVRLHVAPTTTVTPPSPPARAPLSKPVITPAPPTPVPAAPTPTPVQIASASEPAPNVIVAPPPPRPEHGSWTTSRKLGAALVAVGAASLVFGVVEHVRYFSKADEFKQAGCGTNNLTVGAGCNGLNDDFNSAKVMWVVGYTSAVVLGGLGTYLIWPRVEPAGGEGGGSFVSRLTINLSAQF